MGKEAGLPKQRWGFPSLEAGFLGKGAGLSGRQSFLGTWSTFHMSPDLGFMPWLGSSQGYVGSVLPEVTCPI